MTAEFDMRRRRLLLASALGVIGAYSAPSLIGLDVARASGSSGGSGGSGASAGSGGASRGGEASRPPRAERSVPSRRQASPDLPELVISSPSDISSALKADGYRILQTRRLARRWIYRVEVPKGRSSRAARAGLLARFPQSRSDANALYRPEEFACTDGLCAAHTAVALPKDVSKISVKIGMIDTGINPNHEALKGQNLRVIGQETGDRTAAGRMHGTAVAALLIGRATSRTPGLLPNAELIAVEAFHKRQGAEAADAFSIIAAMDQLIAEKVTVINLSFAGPANELLHEMVIEAYRAGIGLVAAAGNGGAGAAPLYPAAWPEVIAVTAVDARERPYRQANRGAHIDFAAPGVNLWAAASISGGRLKSGTSYAAPFVTAALAIQMKRTPGLSLDKQRAALADCARDLGKEGHDEIFGHGIVSLEDQCVNKISAGGGADFLTAGE